MVAIEHLSSDDSPHGYEESRQPCFFDRTYAKNVNPGLRNPDQFRVAPSKSLTPKWATHPGLTFQIQLVCWDWVSHELRQRQLLVQHDPSGQCDSAMRCGHISNHSANDHRQCVRLASVNLVHCIKQILSQHVRLKINSNLNQSTC